VGRRNDCNGCARSGYIDLGGTEVEQPDAATERIAERAASLLPGYRAAPFEYVGRSTKCPLVRGAKLLANDTSSVKVTVWRMTRTASADEWVAHTAPFSVEGDMMLSESSEGDRTLLKVLPDGTTIKLVAIGVNGPDFAGWPTTAVNGFTGPPTMPVQSVADLAHIAESIGQLTSASS